MFHIECRWHYCSQKARHTDQLMFTDEVADYDEAVQQLETICAELSKRNIGERKVCFHYRSDYTKTGATVYTGKLHECVGFVNYVEDYYELMIKPCTTW